MRARNYAVFLGALAVLGLALFTEAATSRSKASSNTDQSSETDVSRLEAKLDQILADQEAILKRFDDVMKELQIIKVRATYRKGRGS